MGNGKLKKWENFAQWIWGVLVFRQSLKSAKYLYVIGFFRYLFRVQNMGSWSAELAIQPVRIWKVSPSCRTTGQLSTLRVIFWCTLFATAMAWADACQIQSDWQGGYPEFSCSAVLWRAVTWRYVARSFTTPPSGGIKLVCLNSYAVAQGGFGSDPHVYIIFTVNQLPRLPRPSCGRHQQRCPSPFLAARSSFSEAGPYGLILREIGGKHCLKKMVRPNINSLWLFNIAMENSPFIDDFPIKNLHLQGIFHGYVK